MNISDEKLRQARQIYDTAMQHCSTCQDYHSLRGYFMATGTIWGATSGAAEIRPAMTKHAPGRPRVLLAGSADTGLLSLVSECYEGLPLEATIVDLCATPLKLCDAFAAEHKLNVHCVCADLAVFSRPQSYDLIFAHAVLTFLNDDQKIRALKNWADSLAPDGRLFLDVRIKSNGSGLTRINHLLEATKDGFPFELPEPAGQFRNRIERYGQQFVSRGDNKSTQAHMEQILMQAGLDFEVLESQPGSLAASSVNFVCTRR